MQQQLPTKTNGESKVYSEYLAYSCCCWLGAKGWKEAERANEENVFFFFTRMFLVWIQSFDACVCWVHQSDFSPNFDFCFGKWSRPKANKSLNFIITTVKKTGVPTEPNWISVECEWIRSVRARMCESELPPHLHERVLYAYILTTNEILQAPVYNRIRCEKWRRTFFHKETVSFFSGEWHERRGNVWPSGGDDQLCAQNQATLPCEFRFV